MHTTTVFLYFALFIGCQSKNVEKTRTKRSEPVYPAEVVDENIEYPDSGDIILVFGEDEVTASILAHLLVGDIDLRSQRQANGNFAILEDDEHPSEYWNLNFNSVADVEKDKVYYIFSKYDPDETTLEIATKYFLKKALLGGKRLKIILTLDYKSLASYSYEAISSLSDFTFRFIRNFETYQNSTLLIVTGVPLPTGAAEDDKFPTYIATFSTEIDTYLTQAKDNAEEPNGKAQKLLDILLETDRNNSLTNFGILGNPNEGGFLDNMEDFRKQQLYLLERLENMQNAELSSENFYLLLSEESEEDYNEMMNATENVLNILADDIVEALKAHYDYNLRDSDDVMKLFDDDIIPSLSQLEQCISSENGMGNIIVCIGDIDSGVSNLTESFRLLYKNLNYLKILKTFAVGEEFIEPATHVRYFQERLGDLLDHYSYWGRIFSGMLDDLKDYRNIIKLNERMANMTMQRVAKGTEAGVHTTYPDDSSVKIVLEKLLSLAMFSELEYTCEPADGKLTVKGYAIVLSKVDYAHLQDCSVPVTGINIFALQKIFIDVIPNQIQNIDIGVVAPVIEAVNLDIQEYLRSSSDMVVYWSFGLTNIAGMSSSHRVLFKPCKGRMSRCSKQVIEHTLKEYKNYVSHDNITLDRTACINFYNEINKLVFVKKRIGSTLGFIDELAELETKFYNLDDKSQLLKIYESLKSDILFYYNDPRPSENTPEYKAVIKRLYTFAMSKIYAIRNGHDENLIVDIEEYLELILDGIDHLESALSTQAIDIYRRAYNNGIQVKVEDAQAFITDFLMPEIDKLLEETENQIQKLVQEIARLHDDLNKDQKYFEEKKRELQKIIERKAIMGAFSILGGILSCFGGVGSVIGGLIQIGVSVAGAVTDNSIELKRNPTALPLGVRTLLERSQSDFNLIEDKRITQLQNKIDAALHSLSRYRNELESSYLKISRLNSQLRMIKINKVSLDRIDSLMHEFDKEMETIRTHGRVSKRSAGLAIASKVVEGAVSVAETSIDVYNDIKDDQEKLEAINDIIEETKAKRNQLFEYEKKVYSVMAPMLKNMEKYVHGLTEGFSSQSEAGLLVSKLEMKTLLKDVNLEVTKMTNGFSVQGDLSRLIEKISETITTTIDIYQRIEQYRDDQSLANLIADVTTAGVTPNVRQIADPKLRDAINKLDEMIKSNIIFAQYKRAVNSYKQYVFPFADSYLPDFSLDQRQVNDSSYIMDTVKEHLENLRDNTIRSRVSINRKVDRSLYLAKFDSNSSSSSPFFIWKNRDYKGDIENLLSGKAVYLQPNVLETGFRKNAVKFTSIGLELKHIRRHLQPLLDDTLKHYRVQMKHMGNSKYKCGNDFYLITSDDQDISFSFEKDIDGVPIVKNVVYDKLSTGIPILSPYTMWKLQLVRFRGGDVNELARFKNEVDLHLVGRGQYVEENTEICSSHLENHYQIVNPYYVSEPLAA